MSRLAVAAAICLWASSSVPAGAVPKVFKYDQFPEDWGTAVSTINGTSLNAQPGFVAGEAFGQIYRPVAEEYPLTITRIDLILGAAPPTPDATINAVFEIYNSTAAGPDPLSQPLFTITTADIFNPATQDLGMPLQGGVAYSIEFDYSDPQNHPPTITEGNIWVVVRFSDPAVDGFATWGTISCFQLQELGACGCQEVAAIHDPTTRPESNVIHHVTPLGQCSGSRAWSYFETVAATAGLSTQGDWILRMHADIAKEPCEPSCDGRDCGDDGCGGSCGSCDDGLTCFEEQCVSCVPACIGRQCGDDGCGGVCGQCELGDVCDGGWCCAPDCDGRVCGGDGCGGTCGACTGGDVCDAGICASPCEPVCGPGACGDDNCGGTCACDAGESCEAGVCVPPCAPACDGRACGDDGCGGTCGICDGDDVCQETGVCGDPCAPDCAGKVCGDDGCGGLCGACSGGDVCQAGACGDPCAPSCDGRACGDDGCGGACGACGAGESCTTAGACLGAFAVIDVSPDFGFDDRATAVSITGQGFEAGAAVLIGGTAAEGVNVVSASVITASVPAGLAAGTYSVIVTNPDSVSASLADAFEVRAAPVTGASDGSGCAGGSPAPVLLWPLALLGLGLAWRRRRGHG